MPFYSCIGARCIVLSHRYVNSMSDPVVSLIKPHIGSTKAVFCLVVFLQLSCHQWMVNAAPLPTCVDQELAITADNKLILYIDGVEVTDLQCDNAAPQADFVPLPASTQVIAASGQKTGKDGGFLGSSGTFVTDASWKCTDQFHEGWQGVAFDDSAWEAAYEVRPHGIKPWQDVEGIRDDAFWIWVAARRTRSNEEKDVYCRKNLGTSHFNCCY